MNKSRNVLASVALLTFFLLITLYFRGEIGTSINQPVGNNNVSLDLIREIATQRNTLSRQLNEARKVIGQYQCKLSKGLTNNQGGWCQNASTENGGQHMTDMSLIKGLGQFLQGKSVASFGDGPGAYKREILKLGLVKSYSAFDGAPFCEKTSEGRVEFMDLTIPQYGIPMYDWVVSLEVAEHIPKQFEEIYLDNIFRHAREGIILSWAVPGQGGLDHINNQPFKYVVDVMKSNGFHWDKTASKKLQDISKLPWIKSNLNVYRRDTEADTQSNEWFY